MRRAKGQRRRREKKTSFISDPEVGFDRRTPNLSEVKQIVMAARSASLPGPSGVPYSIYKRCQELLRKLRKIVKMIWQRGKVAEQWRHAEGVWRTQEISSTLEVSLF